MVCLDIDMPYMNGLEVLTEIRKIEEQIREKRCPVFIITGSSSMNSVLASFENKADAYILKDSKIEERLEAELQKFVFNR